MVIGALGWWLLPDSKDSAEVVDAVAELPAGEPLAVPELVGVVDTQDEALREVVEVAPKPEPVLEPSAVMPKAEPDPEPELVEKALGVDIEALVPELAGTDRELVMKMHRLFDDYDVPEAGVVVLDIKTGKVLAEVGHRNGQSERAAANQARWPGASIFKIVTASALLKVGIRPEDQWCFDGGFRKLTLRDVKGKTGATCSSFATSFARSYNVPFGRWADRRLSPASLADQASKLGFGSAASLGMIAGASKRAQLPTERLEFAQAAAGFGDIELSALHGAMLASLVASGGVATEPRYDDKTKVVRQRLLPIGRAKALQAMMVKTVASGSARRAFREHGRSVMRKDGAGGKTGSLSVKGRDLSWFVGFAPADNPKVAVGAYVANHPTWRIRATYVGREALRSAIYGTTPYRPRSASAAAGTRPDGS